MIESESIQSDLEGIRDVLMIMNEYIGRMIPIIINNPSVLDVIIGRSIDNLPSKEELLNYPIKSNKLGKEYVSIITVLYKKKYVKIYPFKPLFGLYKKKSRYKDKRLIIKPKYRVKHIPFVEIDYSLTNYKDKSPVISRMEIKKHEL